MKICRDCKHAVPPNHVDELHIPWCWYCSAREAILRYRCDPVTGENTREGVLPMCVGINKNHDCQYYEAKP